jgi:hypothetical protein
MEELLTFQKFTAKEDAAELETILKDHKIVYELEGDSTSIDANFIGNAASTEFRIMLKWNDFEKANQLLQDVLLKELEQVDPDHYLFQFSDEELFEILGAKDEWSQYDYLLAQKLLKERGKDINPEVVQSLQKNRIAHLSKPETSDHSWILWGYSTAVAGGFFGIVIGLYLRSHKKTLPNGNRVYAYTKSDREHGSKIAVIGVIMLVISILLRAYFMLK